MSNPPPLVLRAVPGRYVVCRLEADAPVPDVCLEALRTPGAGLVSLTRTAAELSIVCPEPMTPPGARVEGPWRAYVVAGTLDFSLVGILVQLTRPLADAGISVFALSTYNSDYVLVAAGRREAAVGAWRAAGLLVQDEA